MATTSTSTTAAAGAAAGGHIFAEDAEAGAAFLGATSVDDLARVKGEYKGYLCVLGEDSTHAPTKADVEAAGLTFARVQVEVSHPSRGARAGLHLIRARPLASTAGARSPKPRDG